MENKRTKGRPKIEMKMIEDVGSRQISFSKRRSGIYKKAGELYVLCGVEVGTILFSPSGKPHTFATSSIQDIKDKFMNRALPLSDDTTLILKTDRNVKSSELSGRYNTLAAQFANEKEREQVLKRIERARQGMGWWELKIDELNYSGIEQFNKYIQNFKKTICHSRNK